ncbi:MAG: methyltransferase type 11 [Phenylobacterium zucineum]|nr:MAG: methyltransferase type 11 [Phenylobacterium zucineum]
MTLAERRAFLSRHFRRRRMAAVLPLIETAFRRMGRCRIIDLGGRADYWTLFDRAFLEAHKVHITTVNLETPRDIADPILTEIQGDALNLPQFPDLAFDMAHSNSVIEHVGDWENMELFAAQARRLAPAYFVQTPYFWFPIEPHFTAPVFHWLPEGVRAGLLMRRSQGWAPRSADMGEAMRQVRSACLLDKAQMRYLFPDARLAEEKVFGLTKSLMAIRA